MRIEFGSSTHLEGFHPKRPLARISYTCDCQYPNNIYILSYESKKEMAEDFLSLKNSGIFTKELTTKRSVAIVSKDEVVIFNTLHDDNKLRTEHPEYFPLEDFRIQNMFLNFGNGSSFVALN